MIAAIVMSKQTQNRVSCFEKVAQKAMPKQKCSGNIAQVQKKKATMEQRRGSGWNKHKTWHRAAGTRQIKTMGLNRLELAAV